MNEWWEVFAGIVVGDLLRYLLGAGVVFLVLWKWLGRRLAHRRIVPQYPPARQLRREFAYSMSTVVIFAAVGFFVYTQAINGRYQIYRDVGDLGWAYTLASFVVLVVLHDAYFYWTHRALHSRWLFRPVHAVHHRSRNPSPWASYCFHPVEALVQAAYLPLVLVFVPAHATVIFIVMVHMMLRNALGHSGFEIYPRNGVRRWPWSWLTSTTHHQMHHERMEANFGLYFVWWDRCAGTEYLDYPDVFDSVTQRDEASA
jgi:sterol desaturase/sphingolipid hydroxylase (fatty acid hydroxylase superfamily)